MKRIKKVTCAFPSLSGRKSRNMEEIQGNARPEWRVPLFMHPGSTSAKSSQAGVRLCCAPTTPSIALQRVDVLAGRGILANRLNPWQQKQQTVKATSGTCQRDERTEILLLCKSLHGRAKITESPPQKTSPSQKEQAVFQHKMNRLLAFSKWDIYCF